MADSGHRNMGQHMKISTLGSNVMPDFFFAFDNKIFSDRKLLIEVMPDLQRTVIWYYFSIS